MQYVSRKGSGDHQTEKAVEITKHYMATTYICIRVCVCVTVLVCDCSRSKLKLRR